MADCKPAIRVGLLLTGNEILSGDIVDSNSSFMAKQLLKLGLSVRKKIVVGDILEDIIDSIRVLSNECDIVIGNGGLGATVDDLTAQAVSETIGERLIESPEAIENIKKRYGEQFYQENARYYDHVKKQALLPEGVGVLPNPVGLAVGFRVVINDAVFYFTPGVTKEMKVMVTDAILPDIKSRFNLNPMMKTSKLRVVGLGESYLQNIIDQEFEKSTWENIELGFRASLGIVEVKLTVQDEVGMSKLAVLEERMRVLLSHHLVSESGTLSESVFELLIQSKKTISIVDACTGGRLLDQLYSDPAESSVLNSSLLLDQRQDISSSYHELFIGDDQRNKSTDKSTGNLLKQFAKKSNCDLVLGVFEEINRNENSDMAIRSVNIYYGDHEKISHRKFAIKRDWDIFRNFVCIAALDMVRRYVLSLPEDAPYYFDELSRSRLK